MITATGLIPGDPDPVHAKIVVVKDQVQIEKEKQAIREYGENNQEPVQKKVDAPIAPAVVKPETPESKPETPTVPVANPAVRITSSSLPSSTPFIISGQTNEVEPQKQGLEVTFTTSTPVTVDPSLPVDTSSAIPGALIGTSIGFVMFTVLAYILYSRYKARKTVTSWTLPDESIPVPNKSYLNL